MQKQNHQTTREIVKVMERGQITIPSEFRKRYRIKPETFLWIKATHDNYFQIEPILTEEEEKKKKITQFLTEMSRDKESYWEDDEDFLDNLRKRSTERLRELYAHENTN